MLHEHTRTTATILYEIDFFRWPQDPIYERLSRIMVVVSVAVFFRLPELMIYTLYVCRCAQCPQWARSIGNRIKRFDLIFYFFCSLVRLASTLFTVVDFWGAHTHELATPSHTIASVRKHSFAWIWAFISGLSTEYMGEQAGAHPLCLSRMRQDLHIFGRQLLWSRSGRGVKAFCRISCVSRAFSICGSMFQWTSEPS